MDEQATVWQEIDEWLRKRKDAETIEADIAQMARFLSDADSFQASVRRLPSRWSDVIGIKVPRRIGGQREPDLHLTVEFPCRDARAEITRETERREFAVVYRTIRRKLTQRLRKRHWQCLEQMTRSIWVSVNGRAFRIEPFCPDAYAVLLWRMYWEKIDVPQKLIGRQLTLLNVDLEVEIDWIPVSIPDEARLRILELECWRTYRRCCDLARQMQHKNEVTFPLWRVKSSRPGEWICSGSKTRSSYQLHWWWPRRWVGSSMFSPHNQSRKCAQVLLPVAC